MGRSGTHALLRADPHGCLPNGKQEPTRDAVNRTRHESLPHMHPRLGQHAISLRLRSDGPGYACNGADIPELETRKMEEKSGMNSLTDNNLRPSCLWKKLRATEEL